MFGAQSFVIREVSKRFLGRLKEIGCLYVDVELELSI